MDVPSNVSPLDPVPLGVKLSPPPHQDVLALVFLSVYDAEGRLFYGPVQLESASMTYALPQPLQLPLHAAGDWRVEAKVQATVRITGTRSVTMTVRPVTYRELGDVLPAAAALDVPEAFEEVYAIGDTWSGGRVWRYGEGEIALWWAPGPTEKLLYNNALVMLEATYDAYQAAIPTEVEESTWQERIAFRFSETWPDAEGGPGEAWVIQGPDRWLYVLRVRAVGADAVPWLLTQVAQSFRFP